MLDELDPNQMPGPDCKKERRQKKRKRSWYVLWEAKLSLGIFDKYLRKQLEEGNIYLGSCFKGSVHCCLAPYTWTEHHGGRSVWQEADNHDRDGNQVLSSKPCPKRLTSSKK
jgi:hypothetical protein